MGHTQQTFYSQSVYALDGVRGTVGGTAAKFPAVQTQLSIRGETYVYNNTHCYIYITLCLIHTAMRLIVTESESK